MSDIVLLDAGRLGMISHPRVTSEVADWLASPRHIARFTAAEYWQDITG